MSWSLQITNGDLALGTSGMSTVQGSAKLVQDLSCAILEPMGNDPLHPAFGSVLDGGQDPSGQVYPGVIGFDNDAETAVVVESEIQRICEVYQHQQIARNASDVSIYGRSTLTTGEALIGIGAISAQTAEDHLLVQVNLQTGTGDMMFSVPMAS